MFIYRASVKEEETSTKMEQEEAVKVEADRPADRGSRRTGPVS